MPYVDIKVGGKLTPDQKRKIAKDVSSSLEKIAGKPKSSVYVSFTEFNRDSFAKGEELLSDLDKKDNLNFKNYLNKSSI
ncbi:4-oxalocrotonate tautomerase family protein [Helicobacter sp. 13S00477-4]|uniref:tautomerase family protein n=1 Tax=Helicobacter sp. 13S00477-4 TaxID=1905759 RepID=UPI000BA71603|nr:4-oxalocrotonate tautomerase family protein [Helicobacter sp. 13S00477-4]PAF52626.1 4-oxalocrotonate tautomerase [Helicobacter sp. 13S00477-4]